jgi:hypothetical protein
VKGLKSVAGYAIGIPTAFYRPAISQAIYIAVALMWLVPDRRIETEMRTANGNAKGKAG